MSTQSRHPARAALRTGFQAALAFALLWPVIVQAAGLPGWSWVAVSVAAAGGIARVMAVPQVEVFLQRFVPWLSAEPKPPTG
ncbi:MAG TPA: hypothetical protein VFV01_47800 [Spirillospora sp.]|nr:hypothetical protein [Spirillospora sp.]